MVYGSRVAGPSRGAGGSGGVLHGGDVDRADGDGVTVTLDKAGRKEVVRTEYLVGAGGGHSVTRHSMEEHLDGETYGGRYIVADANSGCRLRPAAARVVVGPSGFVLLSLLPEGRLLIFVNRDEADHNAGCRPRPISRRCSTRGSGSTPGSGLAVGFLLPDAQAGRSER